MPDLAALRPGVRNVLAVLRRPLYSRRLAVGDVRTIFGASFVPEGWHHILETLREYDADPDIALERTTLYAFLKHFAPRSLGEWTGLPDCDGLGPFEFPWGWFTPKSDGASRDALNSRFCGPSTDAFIAAEWRAILSLYADLRRDGYHPFRHASGFLQGTHFVACDGSRCFVIMQGNHRLAILAHLGLKNFHVRSDPRIVLPAVYESEVERWPLVQAGRCSVDDALAVFALLFRGNTQRLRSFLAARAGT